MRSKGRAPTTLIIAAILLSLFLAPVSQSTNDSGEEITSKPIAGVYPMYTPHAPIQITSNAQFTPANGVITGSGTVSNPWIISGWEIDGTGSSYCIEIKYTTDYFTIMNCHLHDSTLHGLSFGEVTNGYVFNNNISDNSGYGIRSIVYSNDNIYEHNAIFNNGLSGLMMGTSAGCLITQNTIANNGYDGILIWNCPYWNAPSGPNIICNNQLISNNDNGILIEAGRINNITENLVTLNKDYGIKCDTSYEASLIYHNDIIDNTINQTFDNNIINKWDNSYPSGGNYYSDYNGIDDFTGPMQNIPGSDDIGDTPYNILGVGNKDNYPLMDSWINPTPVHNINQNLSYPSIQLGVDNANSGDLLQVDWGTYYENVAIDKPLTIKGEAPSNTVIKGNGDCIIIGSDYVNITGFTITNNYVGSGIKLKGVQNCTIENNFIINNQNGVNIFTPLKGRKISDKIHKAGSIDTSINNNLCWCNQTVGNYQDIYYWDGDITHLDQVPNDGGYQINPRINDNDNICWQADDGNDLEIYYWNGSLIQLTDNTYIDYSSNINNNNHICWKSVDGPNIHIMYWNGSSTKQITDNRFVNLFDPKINDLNNIYWPGDDGDGYDLYMWDGNNITQLTNNSNYEPVIHPNNNGHVCWQADDGNDYEIFYWNGSDVIQITNNDYNDINLVINDNNNFCWRGYDGEDWEVFYWDGAKIQITNNSINEWDATINDNDIICWSADEGFGREIFLWEDGMLTQIINQNYHNTIPSINDNIIAWDGQIISTNDHYIFVYEFDTGYEFGGNQIFNNEFHDNQFGIRLELTNNNSIFHNKFINNTNSAYDNGYNSFDLGYPDGGNYWSDYSGVDLFSGPNQDQSGSDGIGDTPYTNIQGGVGAQDNYPFIITSEFSIPLQQEWNLISFPLIQRDVSISSVLSSIDGKWDYIQIYDSTDSDHWKTNATFKPDQLNDLKLLNHKIGFWIHITKSNVNLTVYGYEPRTTSITLHAGWNLVGYPTLNDTMTVADAFWGTGATRVEKFDAMAPYCISEVGPTYVMKPGEGYWVKVPADSVWVIDW